VLAYVEEFLNTITVAGMPPHRLVLKVGALSHTIAGTRLVIRHLHRFVYAAIVGGVNAESLVNIPRISQRNLANNAGRLSSGDDNFHYSWRLR
jgi:DNA helicase Pif1-like protein